MKKVLSLVLALVMILSIGTVGASAINTISVSGKPYHVREGNYAYFPLTYDCDIPYGSYADWDKNSETKVIFPYGYASDILKPVDVIPSELLYNMGGTVEIIKDDTFVFPNGTTTRQYIYIEVNFKGFEGIEDGAVLFNVKFEVIKEDFFVDGYLRDDIFDSFYIVDSGNISDFTFCDWKIQKSDGTQKDISKNMEPSLYATFEGVYEDLLIKDYKPFIPLVDCDITEVTYIQQEDTHKDFTVTVNGRKSMIQFIEPDGGTRTYDRYNKNVSITSYNADGEVVNSMARDLAYEVWEIYSNMSVGVEIQVRGKENGKWDRAKYSFTIEKYNPIISMELSATSGKKGPVSTTVIADEKTEKVMFKMPDNTTVTVASKATDENGNKIFTGKAWMNKDGLNEIRILIYRNSVWRQVGTLEYTVE